MAHFIAFIRGMRGEASRLGSKSSGINARINGWHSGVRVEGIHNDKTDKDEWIVWSTSGSSGSGQSQLIAHFDEDGVDLIKSTET